MNAFNGGSSGRPRRSKSGGGSGLRLHQSLSERLRASKQAREIRKATYLSTLPKNRLLRILYRMHPRRVAQYWFSREGAIVALKIIGVGIVVVFLLTIGIFAYFRKDLPKIKDISGDKLGGSITYYDSSGKTVLWQDYDAVKRIPLESNNISPYMKEATVAIEDKNFYHEGAFNFGSIIRAGLHDVTGGGGSLQGASTITQQLVKLNEQWTSNRTVTRKVKELILAVELSREYTKDDILTGYINIAPYGGVEYGCEAAARDYFHVSCHNLTLAQAALLASIPQSPAYYSPYSSPQFNKEITADYFGKEALLDRQRYTLDQMAQQGMITQAQADAAKKVNILAQVHPLTSKYQGILAPYFVLAAKQELEQKYGAETVQRGGWQVITTLNMRLQNQAEKLIQDNRYNIDWRSGGVADEEALVAEDVQKGQIVALVGGVDFSNTDHGQNNYAAGILIPPGSSFKPYDYTTFINNNKNVGAGSVLYDSQGPLPGYPCTDHSRPPPRGTGNCLTDYDFFQPGPITLRYALGGSRNIPAVKAMLSAVPNDSSSGDVASINKTIATASAMMDNPSETTTYNCYSDEALTKTTQCYGASAIGDGAFLYLDDHVNGLATLARLGVAIPRTFISKITDAGGKNIPLPISKPKQVISKDAAYIVSDIASDPNASYLPGYCSATDCSAGGYKFHRYQGWHFAIKTGTTNNGFDGLMTSWSTKYAVVTWVGNHRRNQDISAHGWSMEYFTEPLAKGFMEYAHNGLPPVNWQRPADIKVLPAFVVRNHIHYGDVEPSPSTDLFPSWYQAPSGASTNTTQVIDKVSGGLATSCTPDNAKQTLSNGNATSFSVDKFVSGALRTGSVNFSDNVHNCDDAPPTVTITAPTVCTDTDNGGQGCEITVTVTQGTHPLSSSKFPGSVTVTADGKQIHSFSISSSPSTVTFNYVPTKTGSVDFTATATDSVLYQNSDSTTVNAVATLGQGPDNGNGNGNGNGGGGGP